MAEGAMRVRRYQNDGSMLWAFQKTSFNFIYVADGYLLNTTKRQIKECLCISTFYPEVPKDGFMDFGLRLAVATWLGHMCVRKTGCICFVSKLLRSHEMEKRQDFNPSEQSDLSLIQLEINLGSEPVL